MIDPSLKTLGQITPEKLEQIIQRTAELAGNKIQLLARRWDPKDGAPVFTKQGRYTSQGWTEWTQGFQFGMPLLVYEILGDPWFLEYGRNSTLRFMAVHLTHRGVHDHGFNNISTYGNLYRLAHTRRIQADPWETRYYALALRVSGAVQASRWKDLPGDLGYIYSFNGPQSLFADTIRSLRSLAQAYLLGQVLMEEQDARVNLLRRLLQHGETTARYIVYHGTGRDRWDERGRTAHEAIFNPVNGSFRNPSTQQGYSPFSTWTRGLAWVILGFAEELELLHSLGEEEVSSLNLPYFPTKEAAIKRFLEVAKATADFYIRHTPPDGIPYWDTGAPNLHRLDLNRPVDPANPHEPVDSSAAAIAAQGLLRLGRFIETIEGRGERPPKVDTLAKADTPPAGRTKAAENSSIRNSSVLSLFAKLIPGTPDARDSHGSSPTPGTTGTSGSSGASEPAATPYLVAGLRTALTLMGEPYLSADPLHEGLLLHAVYHRPNGWDYVPPGSQVPHGESCMWGDYHLLELALYVKSVLSTDPSEEPYRFYVKGDTV